MGENPESDSDSDSDGAKDAQTLVSNLGTRPARASKPFSVQVHVPVTRDILPATREAAVSAGETKTAATAFVRRSSNPPSDNSFVKTIKSHYPRPGYTFQTNGKWGDGYYKIISPVPVQSTSLEYPHPKNLHNFLSGYTDMGGSLIPYVIYKGNPMPLSKYKVLYKKHNPPPQIFKNKNSGFVGRMISHQSGIAKVQVLNKDSVSFRQQIPFRPYIAYWPIKSMRFEISTLRKQGGRKYKKKRKSKTHRNRRLLEDPQADVNRALVRHDADNVAPNRPKGGKKHKRKTRRKIKHKKRKTRRKKKIKRRKKRTRRR